MKRDINSTTAPGSRQRATKSPDNDAIVTPAYGPDLSGLGPLAVMVSSASDLKTIRKQFALMEENYRRLFMSRLYAAGKAETTPSIVGPFIGAPYAAIILETLIFHGVRKIIFLGWCGAISSEVKTGDIIVPTGSIIDEGTSAHYNGREERPSEPSTDVVDTIKKTFIEKAFSFYEGLIWTTDAIFRETVEKVKTFQARKVLAVEMETSALFTIGKYRKVDVGAILVVSDELSTLTWRPGFKENRFKEGCRTACEVIVDLCKRL